MTTGTIGTAFCAAVAVAVDDLVATGFESFFSLTTYATITVSQSTGQSGHNCRAAAAAVAAGCITQFVCGFLTHTLVSIVQTVHKRVDDLRMA